MTRVLDSHAFPLTGNRLIEASAGTGKTYTITNLYLRLLLGRDVERPLAINEILVLTFTVAATEELRARIRTRIEAARQLFAGDGETRDDFLAGLIQGSKDREADTRLLSAALQLMDEASVFTIHSFCARVLADNAFETGTLFDQNLDADRDVLLQTAVEDCFRSTILTLPAYLRTRALKAWPSPEALLVALKTFLFRFKLTLLPEETDTGDTFSALVEDIAFVKENWVRDDLPALLRDAGFNARSRCLTWIETMSEFCRGSELSTDLWIHWSSDYMQPRLRKGFELPRHPVLDAIDRIVAAHDQLGFNLWHLVSRTVLENLMRQKVQLSQLTLDDLLIRVHAALAVAGAGEKLAAGLARRWPAAMIDEFQDTDDIQYGIFDLIYGRTENLGIFFIGDPKQAIYQFRGADVFTYINARRGIESDGVYSLSTNWRSNPGLIDGINLLFDQRDIFDNDEDIPYQRVSPSPRADEKILHDENGPRAPIMLFHATSDDARPKKEQIRQLSMAFAAEETVRLLNGARTGSVSIAGAPLLAGNIAFLVRDRHDAKAARAALAERNVRSVYVTLESVFLTDTADDLRIILEAVIDPANETAIRTALAVPLLQTSASEIAAIGTDLDKQLETYQEFVDYHELWAEMDIAPMIEKLMFKRQIAQKWFGRPDGERQVTNLRHLAELLQQRSATAPGMHRLLKWFVREKLSAETVAADERQLRLESDQDLVKIVTMHASKGLEYDVVMIPMAGFTSQPPKPPLMFHRVSDGSFHTCLDFSNNAANVAQAERELLAEDMRLLYVAITRACARCYIGIPGLGDFNRSALSKLLRLTGAASTAIETELRQRLPREIFDVRTVHETETSRFEPASVAAALQSPDTPPTLHDDWHLHSYTGVSRLIRHGEADRQPATAVIPGFADDDTDNAGSAGEAISRFTFPRGPRAGVALHTLLENLDFETPAVDQLPELGRCLDRVGITRNRDQWQEALSAWIEDILATRLPAGCTLGQISRYQRLDEMEFHFPLHANAGIVSLLQRHGYLTDAQGLTVNRLEGAMTGLIDLVFEFDGRFWLADYKSNHLGEAAYTRELMLMAVRHHQYELQYLIYTVALMRYLKARIPGFSAPHHFGGVCYLFLRGMDGQTDAGVFFDRPDDALIAELDEALSRGH